LTHYTRLEARNAGFASDPPVPVAVECTPSKGLQLVARRRCGTVGNHLLQTVPSQIPVVERAIETAAPMLGSERCRAYCLEMIWTSWRAPTWITEIQRCCCIRGRDFSSSCQESSSGNFLEGRSRRHHEPNALPPCPLATGSGVL
jgi:hypothetical protein